MNIGVDIEDIRRFEKKPYYNNHSFYKKIFSQDEIDYCLKKDNPYPHFAVRFSTKEAFIKAYPDKIRNYHAIRVVFEDKKPFAVHENKKYACSLSHTKEQAIAVVLI